MSCVVAGQATSGASVCGTHILSTHRVSSAAVLVRVDAGIELVSHAAVVGASGVAAVCGSTVGASKAGAVSSSVGSSVSCVSSVSSGVRSSVGTILSSTYSACTARVSISSYVIRVHTWVSNIGSVRVVRASWIT